MVTSPAMAPPSDDDVRLSPPLRRFHQLLFWVLSFMLAPVIAVSAIGRNMTPEEMLARLLYRDGLMLVIDKPAGFAVHRGPKGGESLEDYFDALRFGLPRNPALAHRLDKDTSGCLVLGRHRKALALLGKLFKQGKIGKTYWAVVEGAPDADEGRIDIPLGKLDEDARLVDEARPARRAGGDDVEGDGARRRPDLARARAADRADASAARALRGDGLADPRRQYLRPRAARSAGRRCICIRARSWCRFPRTSRR